MKRKTILWIGFLFASALPSAAQFASFTVSGDGYRGDLNKQGGLNGFNVSAGYSYYLEEGLFIKTQLGAGSFSSEYTLGNATVFPNPIPPGFDPTLFVENKHYNGDISLNYEVFAYSPAAVYVGMGVGFLSYRLFDRTGARLETNNQSRISGEVTDGIAFTAPITVGLLLFTNSSAQIALENQWILTNSDYLDNIGYAGERGPDMLVRRSLVIRLGF